MIVEQHSLLCPFVLSIRHSHLWRRRMYRRMNSNKKHILRSWFDTFCSYFVLAKHSPRTGNALFMLFTMLFVTHCCAQETITPYQLFLSANESYKKGNVQQAYTLYQKITPSTPAVHFNLGNCSYRMGNLGMALVHWRRAEWNWGLRDRESLQNNIALVQEKLSEKSPEDNNQSLFAVLQNALQALHQYTISYAKSMPTPYILILVVVFWFMLITSIRYRRSKKFAYIAGYTSLMFLCILSFLAATKLYAASNQQLIVIKTPARLTSGPQTSGFATLGQLKMGKEADILGESGDFYKIRINSTTGWIDKQVVEKI
jgi:hypothetical protein